MKTSEISDENLDIAAAVTVTCLWFYGSNMLLYTQYREPFKVIPNKYYTQ